MSTPYTFRINGVDFSNVITAYGYATQYVPVYSESVTTLDGVEHTTVLRYKGSLTITVRPLEGAELRALTNALAVGIPSITYTCLQRNTNATANMKLDTMSAELVLRNASRLLLGNNQLTFTEL